MTTDNKTEPEPPKDTQPTAGHKQRALFWDVYRNTTPAVQK
jgi:hypothetical protein